MTVTVYADVLFIINFIIDYIILAIAAFLLKKKPHQPRLVFAGILGALLSLCSCFFKISLAISVIFPFLMVFVCFNIKKPLALLKYTAVFYLTSACVAGIGFLALSKSKNVLLGYGYFYADINAYTLLFSFIIAVLVIRCSLGFFKKERLKHDFLYDITIEKNGKKTTACAFFDTGNFLCDPQTQKSVIIAEWDSVKPLFFEQDLCACVLAHPYDFFTVPLNSVGGKSEMFAFLPDKVSIGEKIVSEAHIIGISQRALDKNEAFNIILPNDFFVEKGL